MSTVESIRCKQFVTDRPHKRIEIHELGCLPGLELWSLTDSENSWAMHHDTYSVALLQGETGVASWHSRGLSRTVRAGSIQMMAPGEVHVVRRPSAPLSTFMVCWHPPALHRAALERGLLDTRVLFRRAQVHDPELAALLEQFQTAIRMGDVVRVRLLYESCTDRVLDLAGTASPENESRSHHPRMRRALAYLHEFYADPVSLDLLAQQARLSKYHFSRSFSTMTGLSPHRYQTLLRLQAARRYIEAGSSVEVAAGRIGLADAPHLTRLFGAWLGVSPGAWARGQARPSSKPPRASHRDATIRLATTRRDPSSLDVFYQDNASEALSAPSSSTIVA